MMQWCEAAQHQLELHLPAWLYLKAFYSFSTPNSVLLIIAWHIVLFSRSVWETKNHENLYTKDLTRLVCKLKFTALYLWLLQTLALETPSKAFVEYLPYIAL